MSSVSTSIEKHDRKIASIITKKLQLNLYTIFVSVLPNNVSQIYVLKHLFEGEWLLNHNIVLLDLDRDNLRFLSLDNLHYPAAVCKVVEYNNNNF